MRATKQLSNALSRLVEADVNMGRTKGFKHLESRRVICGSEHAFLIPRGYSTSHVEKITETLVAAVGAPVELIDRGGAVVIRVIEQDFPSILTPNNKDVRQDGVLIGYNRLRQPVYHPLNAHLLVGGASGSGKTDGLRWWLYQLYIQGYEIRICDLKGFSFFPFEPLPRVQIAKSLVESRDMLIESVIELNERKESVIRTRNRDIIKSFKPVVLVIDEAAALSPRQNTGKAKRLAEDCDEAISLFGQQAREPRMSMIYCTQRPAVDVINMQFRANVEAMIGFRCRDKNNSNLIIGKEGAEQISPTTPGRCIYSYDREYYLQVPYVGNDAAWDKVINPLRTEVLKGGSSSRTQPSRIHIDGFVTSASGNDQTTGDLKPIIRSGKESFSNIEGVGEGKSCSMGMAWQRKSMETDTKGKKVAAVYTDEIQ